MERRILVCSHAEAGAGLRRSVALAEGLARGMPDAISLLLTSADPEWMTLPLRLVAVRLPPSGGKASASTDARRSRSLRSAVLGDLLTEFRPDAIVVDGGGARVLRQVTTALARFDGDLPRPVIFLTARDVDVPRLVRATATDGTLSRCDHVLVHGHDVAAARGRGSHAQMHAVGFVAPAARSAGIAAAKAAFGITGPFALCAISSVNAVPLARAFVRDLGRPGGSLRPVVLASPQLGAELRGALRRAAPAGTIIRERRAALEDAIAGADVVVTTMTDDAVPEAVVHVRPLVVLQEAGLAAEQELRRHALAGVTHARVLPRTALRPGVVRAAIEEIIGSALPDRSGQPTGADRAAATIAAVLAGPGPTARRAAAVQKVRTEL